MGEVQVEGNLSLGLFQPVALHHLNDSICERHFLALAFQRMYFVQRVFQSLFLVVAEFGECRRRNLLARYFVGVMLARLFFAHLA